MYDNDTEAIPQNFLPPHEGVCIASQQQAEKDFPINYQQK